MNRVTMRYIRVMRILNESQLKQSTLIAMFGFVLLCGGAASAAAQVKRIEMRIAGYLCGN